MNLPVLRAASLSAENRTKLVRRVRNGIIDDDVLVLLGNGALLQRDMQTQIGNLGRGIAPAV